MGLIESASPRFETLASPALAVLALAQLLPDSAAIDTAPEAMWLAAQRDALPASAHDVARAWAWWLRQPPVEDQRLHRLVVALRLSPVEALALALAVAVDSDPEVARALAWLQAPRRDPHPTLGLAAQLATRWGQSFVSSLHTILDGSALACGLLELDRSVLALSDAGLRVPLPLLTALFGGRGQWPQVSLEQSNLVSSTDALRAQASTHAHSDAHSPDNDLSVRSADLAESRAACLLIAQALGRPAAFITGEPPSGLGPWLLLHNAIPVLYAQLAPGERRSVSPIPGYRGSLLIATGIDGGWERDGRSVRAWNLSMPAVAERTQLWRARGLETDAALTLARTYRLGAERTGQLAQAAEAFARIGDQTLAVEHVASAARRAGRGVLGTLAEPLTEDIDDDALILPPSLREDLHMLVARCQVRDELDHGLGAAARARYRPGVRGLFVGASGTGKTLACGWLATRLGLPLYRVDMASVSSKYIGETEKHLGELFARAESGNVVLLFDEADALFGKRTEVKDAHDRYANQQTNYLLQRIEAYDGIVLLTSNSRSRFDSAFTRRLDAILEFSQPQPAERRALWLAHLGEAHAIALADINRLAAGCELAGGHIRNVVLTARALSPDAPIEWQALASALASEYRKLGKSLPTLIASARGG
jgi:hypothetical protein